jgi:hypothetical protein
MKLLALDPSSTAIGYAFGIDGRVDDAGVLWPEKKSAPAVERIESMADGLGELVAGSCADRLVIEIPSKRTNTRRHGGKGGGLATYGMAVGFVWSRLRFWGFIPAAITLVEPETWTRGKSKASRILAVSAACKSYDPAQDPGGDCADAIALMWWWFAEQKGKTTAAIAGAEDRR